MAVPDVPKLGAEADQLLEVGIMQGSRAAGGGTEADPGRDPFSISGVEARSNCRAQPELGAWAELCEAVGGTVVSPLEVTPASVGMDGAALAELDSLLLRAVADSASPGVAIAVGRHGKLVRLRGYGVLDWGENALPATPASIWDMASVTTVSTTTTAAMILAEAGRLRLEVFSAAAGFLIWLR